MVLDVVVGDALVHLFCTPLRRLMMLQAVAYDLEEESRQEFQHLYHSTANPLYTSCSGGRFSSSLEPTKSPHAPRRERNDDEDDGDEDTNEKEEVETERKSKTFSFSSVSTIGGAARFLYHVGGIPIFFKGATLDVVSVFVRFGIQRYVVLPILRRLPPLPMTSFYVLSTLLHTLVNFLPLAPLHGVVMALNINRMTTFVISRNEEEEGAEITIAGGDINNTMMMMHNSSSSIHPHPCHYPHHSDPHPQPPPSKAATCQYNSGSDLVSPPCSSGNSSRSRSRSGGEDGAVGRAEDVEKEADVDVRQEGRASASFSPSRPPPLPQSSSSASSFLPFQCVLQYQSWWALCVSLYRRLPARRLLHKMAVLEFCSRFFSSFVSNHLLGYFYQTFGDSSAAASAAWYQRVGLVKHLLRRSFPLVVSVGVSLVTYPLVMFPFFHFLRVAHYEFLRREAIAQRLEEEMQGYPTRTRSAATSRRNSLDGSGGPILGSTPPLFATAPTLSRDDDLAAGGGGSSATFPYTFQGAYLDDEEMLDERRRRRGRHLKRSISLGSWWIETVFMRVCHVDVQEYWSSTLEQRGIRGLYSGFAPHVFQIIAHSLLGLLVHHVIGGIILKKSDEFI